MSEQSPGTAHANTLRGGLAITAAQGVKIAAQFGSIAILARLLAPEDFGLVASLSPLLALVAVFQNLGLLQAIVQRPELSTKTTNQIFWTTAAVGFASTVLVGALGPAVAWFYGDGRLAMLSVVAGCSVVLSSLATVPRGLLARRLHFSEIAFIDVTAALLGISASVAGAWLGLGYWALVVAPVFTAFLWLTLSLWRSRYRPSSPPWPLLERDVGTFGAHLTGFNIVNYFARNLDNVLIGRNLGSIPLGHYDRAYKLLMFPLENIVTPISQIMLPILSKKQDDKHALRASYLGAASKLALVSAPGIAAVVPVTDELVMLLFGPGWESAGPVLMWLCIAGLNQPLCRTTGWLFIAQGKTGALLRWGMFSSVVISASFIIGLPFGLTGVAMAYALADWGLRVPGLYTIVHRVGPVRAGDLVAIQAPLAAAALAQGGIVHFLLKSPLADRPTALCALSAALAYGFAWLAHMVVPQGRETLRSSLALIAELRATVLRGG